ncbi:helix-turn-helix domain-containing protein [Paenibacillus sp. GCM10012307]|uniref:Helix-turn-helix transcriptional regulator n=1 Tax=Paenibacillus roseus TaxID=2798579 RepID=A0A934J3E0_9BACL|nr:AraC family transcriptional regulator [Paenibacillus roseus]MBJ6364036.1 helix-turn-helix transcriptional regulator [Paenibacillus roseus]
MQIILPHVELHSIESSFANMPHCHEEHYQITVPLRGSCHFVHENRELALAAGDGLMLHPQDLHSFYLGPKDKVIIFKINDHCLHPASALNLPDPEQRYRFNPSELSGFLQQWTASLFIAGSPDRLALEEKEEQMLEYVHRLIWGRKQLDIETAEKGSHARKGRDNHLLRVLDYMHAHYTDQMSIDELAAVALQSRFHFIRSFKSLTSMTPYQYVLRLRMEEARRQLRHSAATITEISFGLGFSSTSQFYRMFMKSTGMTPEQYRHQSH